MDVVLSGWREFFLNMAPYGIRFATSLLRYPPKASPITDCGRSIIICAHICVSA